MKEADLKRAVNDYLQILMNQGKLYYDQLNSGEIVALFGKSRRRIKLSREGTADFYVLQTTELWDGVHATRIPACRVIFLELKSESGRQSPEQGAFRILVEMQGAEYCLIRSIDELEAILGV